jgi:hypothetical protein
MEFNKTKKENNNEKAFRLTLWVLSILSVIFALVNIQKQGNISEIRQETRNTAKQIKVARQQAQNNSPLFAANNFNLTDQEKTATDRLSQGLQTTFGGLKTENDFKTQKSKIQSLMGKKFANFFVVYNPETSYLNNNEVHVYFNNVKDIHHAKVFAYTQYEVKKGTGSEPLSIAFNFDYDLTTQKVNSYKLVTFSTSDVLKNEGSNQ